MLLVPTMMLRMWRLPAEVRDACYMASLRVVWHMAAPCPGWLKEAFIGWIAPAIVMALYAGTEAIASTVISGAEWLYPPGSVGCTAPGQMKIVGPHWRPSPSGD